MIHCQKSIDTIGALLVRVSRPSHLPPLKFVGLRWSNLNRMTSVTIEDRQYEVRNEHGNRNGYGHWYRKGEREQKLGGRRWSGNDGRWARFLGVTMHSGVRTYGCTPPRCDSVQTRDHCGMGAGVWKRDCESLRGVVYVQA
jgi:hypothetical protein